jgi:hypothetical protein
MVISRETCCESRHYCMEAPKGDSNWQLGQEQIHRGKKMKGQKNKKQNK